MTAEEYLVERIKFLEAMVEGQRIKIKELTENKQITFQIFADVQNKNEKYIVTPIQTDDGIKIALKYEEGLQHGRVDE